MNRDEDILQLQFARYRQEYEVANEVEHDLQGHEQQETDQEDGQQALVLAQNCIVDDELQVQRRDDGEYLQHDAHCEYGEQAALQATHRCDQVTEPQSLPDVLGLERTRRRELQRDAREVLREFV